MLSDAVTLPSEGVHIWRGGPSLRAAVAAAIASAPELAVYVIAVTDSAAAALAQLYGLPLLTEHSAGTRGVVTLRRYSTQAQKDSERAASRTCGPRGGDGRRRVDTAEYPAPALAVFDATGVELARRGNLYSAIPLYNAARAARAALFVEPGPAAALVSALAERPDLTGKGAPAVRDFEALPLTGRAALVLPTQGAALGELQAALARGERIAAICASAETARAIVELARAHRAVTAELTGRAELCGPELNRLYSSPELATAGALVLTTAAMGLPVLPGQWDALFVLGASGEDVAPAYALAALVSAVGSIGRAVVWAPGRGEPIPGPGTSAESAERWAAAHIDALTLLPRSPVVARLDAAGCWAAYESGYFPGPALAGAQYCYSQLDTLGALRAALAELGATVGDGDGGARVTLAELRRAADVAETARAIDGEGLEGGPLGRAAWLFALVTDARQPRGEAEREAAALAAGLLDAAGVKLRGGAHICPSPSFARWASDRRPQLARVLGLTVRKDVQTAPATTVAAALALLGVKTKRISERCNGKVQKVQTVDGKSLADMRALVSKLA